MANKRAATYSFVRLHIHVTTFKHMDFTSSSCPKCKQSVVLTCHMKTEDSSASLNDNSLMSCSHLWLGASEALKLGFAAI